MEFKDIQSGAMRNARMYGEEYGVMIDEEFSSLKLFEEAGEFAQAMLVYRRKSRPEKFLPEIEAKNEVAKELADVVGMALVNAELLGIDLEEVLKEKWINRRD